VKRSTYYSWLAPKKEPSPKKRMTELTPHDKTAIEKAKEDHPQMRHRQLQGVLQNKGLYLSFSAVYTI